MTSKKGIARIIAPMVALAMTVAMTAGCGGGGGKSAQSSSNLKLRIELPRDAAQEGESYNYTYNALINVTSHSATGAPTSVASTTSTLTYNSSTHKTVGTFFITQIPVGANYIVAAHVSSSDNHTAARTAGQTSSTFAHVGALVDTISDSVTADITATPATTMKALAIMYYAKSRNVALSNTTVVSSSVKSAIGSAVDALLADNSELSYQYTSDYYTNGDPFDPANWTELFEQNLAGIVAEAGLGPQAQGIIPANNAVSFPYDQPAFQIIFNQSMDTSVNLNDSATLLASAFRATITNVQYNESVIINTTNAAYYGTFSWTTTTVANDTLTFTLFPAATLQANVLEGLEPATQYSISLTVPGNLLTLLGEAMPVPSPFVSAFTTAAYVDDRVFDNARVTGEYIMMSICAGGDMYGSWYDTEKSLIVSNGDGTGTFQNLESSYEEVLDSGTFSYYVLPDGTMMIIDDDTEEDDPYMYATVTADGTFAANSDIDDMGGSSCLDLMVKKSSGMTLSAAAGEYIISEFGVELMGGGGQIMPRAAAVTGTCSMYTDFSTCSETPGCYWDGYDCLDNTSSCSSYTNETECISDTYCYWDGYACQQEYSEQTSGYPVIKRDEASIDSSGNISMTELASSSNGGPLRIAHQTTSPFTMTVASDGAINVLFEGEPAGMTGYVVSGGNMFVMIDTDATDGYISMQVGVRKSTAFSTSSLVDTDYVLHQVGMDYIDYSWAPSAEVGILNIASGSSVYTTLTPEYWDNGTYTPGVDSLTSTFTSDGQFTTTGDEGVGIVSPDGKFMVISDTELSLDNWINFMVGVRKTPVSGD